MCFFSLLFLSFKEPLVTLLIGWQFVVLFESLTDMRLISESQPNRNSPPYIANYLHLSCCHLQTIVY